MRNNHLLAALALLLIPFFTQAEGTRQVAPNGSITIMGSNTTDIAALHLDHPSYDNFAAYTNPDVTDRLQIRILDPSAECIHLGFSKGHLNVTGMNPPDVTYEFRIKDPSGNVIYGPITISPTDANVSGWGEAFMGPEEINGPGGYQSMVVSSSDLTSGGWNTEGDYYIEFQEATNQPFLIDYWDITVADCSGTFPEERPGRIWSYNWAFFAINDFGFPERPFNGAFYVCAPDPDNVDAAFVTKIDFNNSGFRPAAFVVAFNSFGSMNTGVVTEDRKSAQDTNSTQAEYAIFLNDPLEFCETAVVGELELFGVARCAADEYCIKFESNKEGQIDLLLDFDGPDSVFTPGTADLIVTAEVTADMVGVPSCIDWDGLDGLGNPISDQPGTEIPLILSYAQGVYHFPIYDAEFMDNGFRIEAIRPTGPTPLLYYDDSNIDTPSGSGEPDVQLSGCDVPCHTWSVFNDPNVPGFGNLNTINSWWFAQQVLTQEIFVVPTYFECSIDGPDVVCMGDTATLTWNSISLPEAGEEPNIVSITWDGPGIVGETTGNVITISAGGTYFADMLWLTVFGDTCAASCEFTLEEGSSSVIEIDTMIGYRDTLVINNEEYFESGEYEQVFTTSDGCDSVLIIRLTVPETVIYYDLDNCSSYVDEGTNTDYSEFEPQYPNPLECGDLEATILYRDNPELNPHSCTPGVDSSIAMCVGSLAGCDYEAGSDKSVVFEITISPDTENNVVISSLSFWEKGPEEFDWIDGFDGPNNYPTLYGIRVLKDGTEIFRMEDVATELVWNEEFYDFSGIEEFTADDTAVYRFELLGYCIFNNGSTVSAWDLDEFTVHASCVTKPPTEGIIEGVITEVRKGTPMSEVVVQVGQDVDFIEFGECLTDPDGGYTYDAAKIGMDNYARAYSNADILKNITVFDLLAMQKHMLGLAPFAHEYQYIAADVTNDGILSAADIVELRKLMLGKIEEFSRNTSWRFFDSGSLEDPDPFDWKEVGLVRDFQGQAELNFTGVKIGDVIDTGSGASGDVVELRVPNMDIRAGQSATFPVYLSAGTALEGMQLELVLTGLSNIEITAGAIGTEAIYHSGNIVRTVWSDPLRPMTDEALFYISAIADHAGQLHECISVSDGNFGSTGYEIGSSKAVEFGLTYDREVHTELTVTALPNPAGARTVLTINTPGSGNAALQVYTASGQLIFSTQVGLTEGVNRITLNENQLAQYKGLSICRIESEYGTGIARVVFQ